MLHWHFTASHSVPVRRRLGLTYDIMQLLAILEEREIPECPNRHCSNRYLESSVAAACSVVIAPSIASIPHMVTTLPVLLLMTINDGTTDTDTILYSIV